VRSALIGFSSEIEPAELRPCKIATDNQFGAFMQPVVSSPLHLNSALALYIHSTIYVNRNPSICTCSQMSLGSGGNRGDARFAARARLAPPSITVTLTRRCSSSRGAGRASVESPPRPLVPSPLPRRSVQQAARLP